MDLGRRVEFDEKESRCSLYYVKVKYRAVQYSTAQHFPQLVGDGVAS